MGVVAEHLLICGSRDWDDENLLEDVVRELGHAGGTVRVGDCPTGADAMAYAYFEHYIETYGDRYYVPYLYPKFEADWDTHGKAAGPIRNKEMLDNLLSQGGTDKLVIGFYKGKSSRGTQNMIDQARAAGVDALVYYRA